MTTDSNPIAARARNQAMLYGVLSLALAGATGVTAWWVVSRYEARLSGTNEADLKGEVVVAARDLRSGSVLSPEDLVLGPRPPGVPADRLYTDPSSLIGQVVGEHLLPGEAVRYERLTVGGSQLRLDEVIDPGARAVTIRTNHASAVGGLLRPGYFVDVIVTIRPDTRELDADWVTETILQGVRVIAVNDVVSTTPVLVEPGAEKRAEAKDIFVTLEVEPAEAEEVALASSRGQIHLSLRATGDFEMLDPGKPLVANALVGLPTGVAEAQKERLERKKSVAMRAAPAPVVAPPAPTQSTDIIRGHQVTTEQFDEEGRRVAPSGRGR